MKKDVNLDEISKSLNKLKRDSKQKFKHKSQLAKQYISDFHQLVFLLKLSAVLQTRKEKQEVSETLDVVVEQVVSNNTNSLFHDLPVLHNQEVSQEAAPKTAQDEAQKSFVQFVVDALYAFYQFICNLLEPIIPSYFKTVNDEPVDDESVDMDSYVRI